MCLTETWDTRLALFDFLSLSLLSSHSLSYIVHSRSPRSRLHTHDHLPRYETQCNSYNPVKDVNNHGRLSRTSPSARYITSLAMGKEVCHPPTPSPRAPQDDSLLGHKNQTRFTRTNEDQSSQTAGLALSAHVRFADFSAYDVGSHWKHQRVWPCFQDVKNMSSVCPIYNPPI